MVLTFRFIITIKNAAYSKEKTKKEIEIGLSKILTAHNTFLITETEEAISYINIRVT